MAEVTGYSVYKPESEQRRKCNPLGDSFPKLPTQTYDIIYADPPWDYHGKMQYDLLFLWTTGPQMANAISLGSAWGFAYKTVAFVWDKMNHNPGRYTLSQTEFCLVFKKGRIPSPRGARNVKQLVRSRREAHSAKPEEVIDGITAMFPSQRKIDLFARRRFQGWDAWGLEAPS